MSDAENVPPSPPSRRPLWPRIAAPFTAQRITAAFTIILALATLALVGTAIVQHMDAVDAIEATKRLATANENTAKDRRQIASAELILKIGTTLAQHRYDRIIDDIQSHDSNYRLPKYKNRTDADVEEYIGVFDDMGYFIKDDLISEKMAYDHFSYDIEKAWCNIVVQEVIRKQRATDKARPRKATRSMGISRDWRSSTSPTRGRPARTWINNSG
jgi:hypothetical protein